MKGDYVAASGPGAAGEPPVNGEFFLIKVLWVSVPVNGAGTAKFFAEEMRVPEHGREAAVGRVEEIAASLAEQEARARDLAAALRSRHPVAHLPERAEALAAGLQFALEQVARLGREVGDSLESAQQSRALGLSVIRAQEEERRRVAREIHDGPAQLLANVVLRIDVCQRLADQDPARLAGELQQLKELVRVSLQDVRKVIFDLRPMALDDLGLVPALRAYAKEYQARTAIEVDLAAFGADRRFDPAFEVAVFRLVQEALTNVDKHARASKVWVTIEMKGNELRVTVKDNGSGFDVEAVRRAGASTRFGLHGMAERVALVGGRMEIQSAPGQGTRLQFSFARPE